MSFSLKVESNNGNSNTKPSAKVYQKPGIYENVRISEVVFGKSTQKGTPYIRLKTIGQNGEEGNSSFMYLSTVKSPGKTAPAWNVTARNIQELLMATHNMSKADAEGIDLVPDDEKDVEKQYKALVDKVSSLLVGRPFRAKFKGEQTKENGIIYATLDRVESMNVPAQVTSLKFNAEYDIKMYVNLAQPQDAIPTTETDGLPF
jgi:hypothetical protein